MRKTSHKRNQKYTPFNGKPIAQSVSPSTSYALAEMLSQWLLGIFLPIELVNFSYTYSLSAGSERRRCISYAKSGGPLWSRRFSLQ
jgi:hypothetical protein